MVAAAAGSPAQSMRLTLDMPLRSKSRAAPALVHVDLGQLKIVLYSDPLDDLVESFISAAARSALRSSPSGWPLEALYAVEIQLGTLGAGRKADVDNSAKLILDALSGVIWDKDSRVSRLTVSREDTPHTIVDVTVIASTPKFVVVDNSTLVNVPAIRPLRYLSGAAAVAAVIAAEATLEEEDFEDYDDDPFDGWGNSSDI